MCDAPILFIPISSERRLRVFLTLVRMQNGDVKITVGNFESELRNRPRRRTYTCSLYDDLRGSMEGNFIGVARDDRPTHGMRIPFYRANNATIIWY